MRDADVRTVRSFNRLVTERVGALEDRYLATDRPLGEARLLWEIGRGQAEVRGLRRRLALDSGYLSRLLQSLEAAGLVRVRPSEDDRRVRLVELTGPGRAERTLLDRRSDALARSFLEPLDDHRRARLVEAMTEVERLLTAPLVAIDVLDPDAPAARACLDAYAAELARRFETGFDPQRNPMPAGEVRPPSGLFLVATLHDEPVGCGALKLHGDEPAELARIWVSERVRGLGLGRRLLGELERRAAETGATTVRLDTNGALTEAGALYRSAGYREVEPFNDNPYAHHWFEKPLEPAPG
jgi:DNA-binding MarR family transcriptional regulator/ribosomal protein S18 acetylase RimI-like enzyme